MAIGDFGGAITELVITCRTPAEGEVAIEKGDALALVGPYTVTNAGTEDGPIFGEALAEVDENNAFLPVKVRGISLFTYVGTAPTLDGETGVTFSDTPGVVQAPVSGSGSGRVVDVRAAASLVHVLL